MGFKTTGYFDRGKFKSQIMKLVDMGLTPETVKPGDIIYTPGTAAGQQMEVTVSKDEAADRTERQRLDEEVADEKDGPSYKLVGENLVRMAAGGSFMTDSPTLFLAGEAGAERVDVTPLSTGSGPAEGGPAGRPQYFLEVDGKVFGELSARYMPHGAAKLGRRLP